MYRLGIHKDLAERIGCKEENYSLYILRFLEDLKEICPKSKYLSNVDFLIILDSIDKGSLSVAELSVLINGYKIPPRHKKVNLMDPLRKGLPQHNPKFKNCPHGIPKNRICAICDPDRFREFHDYD